MSLRDSSAEVTRHVFRGDTIARRHTSPLVGQAEFNTWRASQPTLNRGLLTATEANVRAVAPLVELLEYLRARKLEGTQTTQFITKSASEMLVSSLSPPMSKMSSPVSSPPQRFSISLTPSSSGSPPLKSHLDSLVNGDKARRNSAPPSPDLSLLKNGSPKKSSSSVKKKNWAGLIFAKMVAKDSINALKSLTPSVDEVIKLSLYLADKPMPFTQKFVKKGGPDALLGLISCYARKRVSSSDEDEVYKTCLQTIGTLLQVIDPTEEMFTALEMSISSFVVLEIPSSDDFFAAERLSNLVALCSSARGHKIVSQALRTNKMLAILVSLLKLRGDELDVNSRAMQISCLTMINKLVKLTTDLEMRFNLECEFLAFRIFPRLLALRELQVSEVEEQVDAFFTSLETDYSAISVVPAEKSNKEDLPMAFQVSLNFHRVNVHAHVMVPCSATDLIDVINRQLYSHLKYLYDGQQSDFVILSSVPLSGNSPTPLSPSQTRKKRARPTPEKDSQAIAHRIQGSFRRLMERMDAVDATLPSSLPSGSPPRYDRNDSFDMDSTESCDSDAEDLTHTSLREEVLSPPRSPMVEKNLVHVQEYVFKNPMYGKRNPLLRVKLHKASTNNLKLHFDKDTPLPLTIGTLVSPESALDKLPPAVYEFRAKSWKLQVRYGKKDIHVEVDPDMNTFGDVVAKALRHLDIIETDRSFEYGLRIVPRDKDGGSPRVTGSPRLTTQPVNRSPRTASSINWVDPSKPLGTWSIEDREKFKLELKMKPLPVIIKTRDGISHTVWVIDRTTARQVLADIGDSLEIPQSAHDDYGLCADGVWLKDNEEVAGLYKANSECNLQFLLKLKPITLVYPTHAEFAISGSVYNTQRGPVRQCLDATISYKRSQFMVHFTQAVAQVHAELCEKLSFDVKTTWVYSEAMDGKVESLLEWKSLRNQGVPYQGTLFLFKREETGKQVHEDVNIWDEQTNPETLVLATRVRDAYDPCPVDAGTFNQLVKILTSESDHDPSYMRTFMLTFKSMASSKLLLQKLSERFNVPMTIEEKTRITIKQRVCVVLKNWIGTDDADGKENLLDDIGSFVDSFSEDQRALAKFLHNSITNEKTLIQNAKAKATADSIPPLNLSRSTLMASSFTFLDVAADAQLLAIQLTISEFDVFSKIKHIEFFNQAWNNPKLQHKAVNILKMIDNFNQVSRIVATSIVTEKNMKARVKIMERNIEIAMELLKLNSFNLLTAFISGLNNSACSRLKYTREKISKQHQQDLLDLETLMNMESSYKKYRGAKSEVIPPCIPYLGVYLVDLTFIDDGNPDYINNLINFAKRHLVGKILAEVEMFKVHAYKMQGSKVIDNMWTSLPQMSDRELYQHSLICEPRDAPRPSIK